MTEAYYGPSFQIIAEAGDSKGYSKDAIRAAKAGDFEKAENHIKKANERLLAAHSSQTDIITQEASGNHVPVNIILVHSQDHLAMAMAAEDLAEEMLDMYRQMYEIKQELNELRNTAKL